MSNAIIVIFIVEFVLLALVAVFEENWGMVLYGVGGCLLNTGVLFMK